jgi:hypothetical protein
MLNNQAFYDKKNIVFVAQGMPVGCFGTRFYLFIINQKKVSVKRFTENVKKKSCMVVFRYGFFNG